MTRAALPAKKWILLNPGPVNVTDRVRRALLEPDICHREPEFLETLASVRASLPAVFGISKTHEAALFAGSGTLAVEAMLSSAGHAGEKFLVLSNGVYGERMADILKRHRIAHHVLRGQGLAFPDLKDADAFLKKNRSVTAIAVVHHETSTGHLNPLEAVARLARKHGIVVHVDAVSSLGAEDIPWHLPIAYAAGASGKCLHGFPGVAFVLVSKKEIPCLQKHPNHSLYLDLGGTLAVQRTGGTPFTPSVQLIYALKAALDELKAETVARRIASYRRKARALQNALEAAGIEILAPAGARSHVLTAARLPVGVDYEPLHDWMRKNGFLIYAGQAQWRDRIFRLANLGQVTEAELKRAVALVKQAADRAAKPLVGQAVLLAAGVGKRFGAATKLTPKCLLPLPDGGTLLERYLNAFRVAGIRNVTIVVGHQRHLIQAACRHWLNGPGRTSHLKVRFRVNRRYRLGSIVSLWTAKADLTGGAVILDADVHFPADLLRKLREDRSEAAFLMDPRAKSTGEEMILQAKAGRIVKISKPLDAALKPMGEATGIFKVGRKAGRKLAAILDRMVRRGVTRCEYEDAYCELMKTFSPACVPVGDVFWTEIDFPSDLAKIPFFSK